MFHMPYVPLSKYLEEGSDYIFDDCQEEYTI